MARLSDPKKLALWQERFQRFFSSDLSVARFCAIEHLSESSFYYWQKKLGPRALRRPTRAEDHGTCAEDGGASAEDRDACSQDRNVFQPVTVVPATCGVVVRLPGGTQIEVGTEHLDAIRAVVAETVRADHGWAAERNASSDNRVMLNASTDNQVIRKRGTIGERDGVMRMHGGAASC